MLTFAVAAGPSIPPSVLAVLHDPEPGDVPFRPEAHLVWSNPAGTVVFAGWDDGVDAGCGRRWLAGEGGVTAYTGNVWPRTGPWAPGEASVAQLARHLERHPLAAGTAELLGVFTAVSLDAGGEGTIAADPLGTSLVYRAGVAGTSIVSSRGALAARLAAGGGEPRRDVLGAGWLAYCEYPMGLGTGFAGVELLPLGARARVSPAGIRVHETVPPWRDLVDGEPEELLDGVHADALATIRAALALPVGRRVAELTGGKDSRLVLALLVGAGLAEEFEFRTLGAPEIPDVRIAADLADRFGLHHEVGLDPDATRRTVGRFRAMARRYPDLEGRERLLRLNVGAWSGMRDAWELQAGVAPHGDRVTLNGMYGESLSTNYSSATRLRNHAEVRQDLLVHMKHGVAGILRPEALEHYRGEVMRIAYEGLSVEDPPQLVMDALFLRNRLRRWFGSTQELDERNPVFPLYSPFGVRLAFSLPVGTRHGEWIHRELYRRTCDELAEVPFAKGGWRGYDAPERRPEPADLAPLRPLEQVPKGDTGPPLASITSRQREEPVDAGILRRHLLDDPTNPVHDILDRAGVERALDGFADLSEWAKRQLYGAFTAAVWLGGNELALPRR